MARLTPQVRRQAIVDAALKVAKRKGLSTTTVRDVAFEMGTSSGLIHHYFDSMDQLLALTFRTVAKAELTGIRVRMEAAETATGRIAEYFAAFTDPANDENFHFWLDAWSEAARNETIREASRELNIEWQELLSEVIESGILSGEFTNVDVEAVSWRALSLLDGLELQLVAHPTVLTRDQAAEWAAGSIERDLGLPVGAIMETLSVAETAAER